jgi:Uma2 family endonuclease
MATALNRRHQTLEEFLAWEREQSERYERVSGVIRMMTGGTLDHNRITLNVADALRQRLRGSKCEVFVNDVKVVTPAGDVMYPDVVVACGDLPGKATVADAPVVIVEILSESTVRSGITAASGGPTRRSRLCATMCWSTRTRAGSR